MGNEADSGWRVLPDGALQSSSGTVFRRTPRRVTRRLGHELVDAGSPVVTDVYPDGVTWTQGAAAREVWIEIVPRLVTGRRPDSYDLNWTGHVWESESGLTLLRFQGEGCA